LNTAHLSPGRYVIAVYTAIFQSGNSGATGSVLAGTIPLTISAPQLLPSSDVRLLGTTEAAFEFARSQGVGTTGGSTHRKTVELIDLGTMISFNISWAVSRHYHTDWDPLWTFTT